MPRPGGQTPCSEWGRGEVRTDGSSGGKGGKAHPGTVAFPKSGEGAPRGLIIAASRLPFVAYS